MNGDKFLINVDRCDDNYLSQVSLVLRYIVACGFLCVTVIANNLACMNAAEQRSLLSCSQSQDTSSRSPAEICR
jgi:hypothetical protein